MRTEKIITRKCFGSFSFNDIEYDHISFPNTTNETYNIQIEIRQYWISIYVNYQEIINYDKVEHDDNIGVIEPIRLGSLFTQNSAVKLTDINIDSFYDDIFTDYYNYPLDSLYCANEFTYSDGTTSYNFDFQH